MVEAPRLFAKAAKERKSAPVHRRRAVAYQSGVPIDGYSHGCFEAGDPIRIGAWLTVVEFAVLVLPVPFYRPLIGNQ